MSHGKQKYPKSLSKKLFRSFNKECQHKPRKSSHTFQIYIMHPDRCEEVLCIENRKGQRRLLSSTSTANHNTIFTFSSYMWPSHAKKLFHIVSGTPSHVPFRNPIDKLLLALFHSLIPFHSLPKIGSGAHLPRRCSARTS